MRQQISSETATLKLVDTTEGSAQTDRSGLVDVSAQTQTQHVQMCRGRPLEVSQTMQDLHSMGFLDDANVPVPAEHTVDTITIPWAMLSMCVEW